MRLSKRIFPPVFLLLMMVIALSIFINSTEQVADTANSGDVRNVVDKVDSLIDTMQSEPRVTATGEKSDTRSDLTDGSAKSDITSPDTASPETATNVVDSFADSRGEMSVESNTEPSNMSETASVDSLTNSPGISGLVEPQSNEATTTDESYNDAVAMSQTDDSEKDESDEKVADGNKGSSQSLPTVSRKQLQHTWQQARIAAWYGDVDRAINYYQTVIALQPDNYDAYGEMGNVMLRAGDQEGAVEAYYQAARLLNRTPYRAMAWHLLNVIAGLSPPRAEKLYQELKQP